MSPSDPHIIGRHDADITTLKEDMRELRASNARIEKILAEHRGGFRVLAGVATVGGAVGAGLVKLFATVKGA